MPKRHAILPVKDVKQQYFILRLGHYLRKTKRIEVMDKDHKLPEWVDHAKTGCFKELAPINKHWLYHRMASVMRRVYMRHPVGVGGLARRYGGLNKRRGVRPNKTGVGAQKNIRYVLQAAEKNGWMRKAEKGRVFTREGLNFMEEFAGRIPRSRMVRQYWRRRKKQDRLLRKLKRKEHWEKMVALGIYKVDGDHAITAGGGDDGAEQDTMGGGDDEDYEHVQADQGDMEMVREFED